MTVVLLVHVRGEISFLPAFTAVLVYNSDMDTLTDYSVVSTGYSGNDASASSYCNIITSHFYGYMDCLECC
jgi:hypothetical protein